MAYKLSAKAKAAKKKRDLKAAKTPKRRRIKAENQRRRRKIKDKSTIKGKDYDHKDRRFESVKKNRGNDGQGTKKEGKRKYKTKK